MALFQSSVLKKPNKTKTIEEEIYEPLNTHKPNKPKEFEEINEPLKAKTKNKWLYPTDSFGNMEEGVVTDS
jgi:hypothetical protein